MTQGRTWVLVLARMPAQPARHRMALWRELRRAGAVPVGQGAWCLPQADAVEALIARAEELAQAAGGEVLVLDVAGRREVDVTGLEQRYRAERDQEWAEFRSDADKYLAELDHEEEIGKYTLAELEEEEQSLERLRRWFRDLRARDVLGTTSTSEAAGHLKRCEARLEEYAERVYATRAGDEPPRPRP